MMCKRAEERSGRKTMGIHCSRIFSLSNGLCLVLEKIFGALVYGCVGLHMI
jgi:hypothetical protein